LQVCEIALDHNAEAPDAGVKLEGLDIGRAGNSDPDVAGQVAPQVPEPGQKGNVVDVMDLLVQGFAAAGEYASDRLAEMVMVAKQVVKVVDAFPFDREYSNQTAHSRHLLIQKKKIFPAFIRDRKPRLKPQRPSVLSTFSP